MKQVLQRWGGLVAAGVWLVVGVVVWAASPYQVKLWKPALRAEQALERFSGVEFGGEIGDGWTFSDLGVRGGGIRLGLSKGGERYWVYLMPPDFNRWDVYRDEGTFRVVVPRWPESEWMGEPVNRLVEAFEPGGELWEQNGERTNLPVWLYQALFLLLLLCLTWRLWRWEELRRLLSSSPFSRARERGTRVALSAKGRQGNTVPTATSTACQRINRVGPPMSGSHGTQPGPAEPSYGSSPSLSVLPWIGLLATGTAISLLWGVAAPLHNNHHGIEELEHLLYPMESPYPGYYGRCFQAFFDGIFGLGVPRSLGAVWWIQSILAGLVAVFGGRLAWRLTGRQGAGLVTAALLLTFPHLARVGTSETPFLLALLLALVAAGEWIDHARRGEGPGWFIGGLALLLAVQLHTVTAVFLAIPVLSLVFVSRRSWKSWAAWGAGLLAVLAWCLPHLLFQFHRNVSTHNEFFVFPETLFVFFSENNLFFRWDQSPLVFPVLAVVGLVALAVWRRRAALFFVGLAGTFFAFHIIDVSFSDVVRYQVVPAVFLVVLGGAGLWTVLERLTLRWRLSVGGLVVVLTAVSILFAGNAVLRPDAEADEFEVMLDIAEELPAAGILVVLDDVDQPFRIRHGFPEFLLHGAGKACNVLQVRSFLPMNTLETWPEEPVYLYIGLSWWWIQYQLKAHPEDETQQGQRAVHDFFSVNLGGDRDLLRSDSIRRRPSPLPGRSMAFTPLIDDPVNLGFLKLGPRWSPP